MPQRARSFFTKPLHVLEEFSYPPRRAVDPDGIGSQAWTSAPQRLSMPLPTRGTAPLSQPAITPTALPPVPPSAISTPASPGNEPHNPVPIPAPSSSPETPVPHHPTSSPAILSLTPSSQPQYFHAYKMFHNAQDFTINNSQFNDVSLADSGLKELLKYSMPGAFHDSGARYPPPKCHLGTRKDHIELIINWALGKSDRKEPILWMHGPFGVGKSAVAQSCAEALEPMNKLAGTLFFSRSNAERNDPRRVFTSIAYQIATTCPSFREIINNRMIEDPVLTTKLLSTQFKELLVRPLGQVNTAESGLQECVVIIDGLDECRGTAEQCEIIRIVAASVDKHTTPFRWFFTSRPEDPIIRTMNSHAVSPVRSRIELPVSREIDHEILVYLTNEFKKIREDHGLPELWPGEEALALLVERGAGLWVYVATIVRFIKDENSLGPEDQMLIVLKFAKDVSAMIGLDNPLVEMDFFYTLIMQRVSLKVRTVVQKILLIHSALGWRPDYIANALRLSPEQLRRACTSIQSVMELQGSDSDPDSMVITFYHASFLDFMRDPKRSKELCIYGDFLIGCRREILGWLHEVCSRSTDSSHIAFPSGTILPDGVSGVHHYHCVLGQFWKLSEVSKHPLDFQTAMSLTELPFKRMLKLLGRHGGWRVNAGRVRDNFPAELCDKIVRKGKCPISGCMNAVDVWLLGHGENEMVPSQSQQVDGLVLENNYNPPDGRCPCGARMRKELRGVER
ncbi:hypothetical protein D9756_003032 [Leucocoprinus leucothites]|uniref:Nephrocystin 3-like N-terminal domain-containing protein n=1 Tax=Leucocoprinus leucothites TaxID=201217 RepID=A0A8H5G6R2_9AGAR|nr:hypothetical protein D9756_003032 [Leucoagaricus leucothites]